MTLSVVELESRICNQGRFIGYPTTYVKLFDCNLDCSYCKRPKKGRKKMSVPTLLTYLFKMGNTHVVITGGEPLLQDEIYPLLYDLVDRGYKVTIETNGSIDIPETLYTRSYSYSMAIKCPSSKMHTQNKLSNLENLHAVDEVRFEINDINDYVYALDIIRKYPTKATNVFIPKNKEITPLIAQWMLEDRLHFCKLFVPYEFKIEEE